MSIETSYSSVSKDLSSFLPPLFYFLFFFLLPSQNLFHIISYIWLVTTSSFSPVFSRRNILLNYAVYNCRLGYTQGMSDLLAPLLAELNSEIEAFWCFAGLMQRSVAVCTPTDVDMDRNLCYLRELVRIMVPDFYAHLQKHTDALELLFCHRWILLYVQLCSVTAKLYLYILYSLHNFILSYLFFLLFIVADA